MKARNILCWDTDYVYYDTDYVYFNTYYYEILATKKKKKVIRKYFLVADFFKKEKENRNISSRIYFKAALVLILNYQEWLIGVL